jgi:2-(3-amino-3-carboxypropyl)histidine synthase
MAFNFEYEKLVKELKKKKPKKVLVQLPEGIKKHSFEIEKLISDLGIKVVFSGQTCWGGCCVSVEEADSVGADLIVHFGHAKFINVKFPVLYVEVKDELNLKPLLNKSLKALKKFKSIGLSYSIQHRHDLGKIVKFYEDNKKKVILSTKKGLVAYEGHIVGCQYEGLKEIEKKVEVFVIIGNNFHSMGASIAVKKPVVLVDVYNDDIKIMKGVREKILKQRAISISKLKDAKKVGILIERKPGQKFGNADILEKDLKKQGKEVVVIDIDEMTRDKLMNFYYVDCFIDLGCPRIAVDDFAKYGKPIVTFKEALIAIGKKTWTEGLKTGLL